MATVDVASADPLTVTANALVVGVFTGGIEGPGVESVISRLGLEALPLTPDFRGDIGQHLTIATPALSVDAVVFVGLGRMVATDAERLRTAAMVAADVPAVTGRVVTTLAHVHASPDAVAAIAEGFLLGDDRARRRPAPARTTIDEVTVLVPSGALEPVRPAVAHAQVMAAATARAMAMVNAPPNELTPRRMADRLAESVDGTCTVVVHDRAALARDGCHGVLSAAAAAASEPFVVELRYEPDEPLGHVALCGLGATFDAGGLTLADRGPLTRGKAGMAGAAAVGSACGALADLDARVRVTALLGLVEHLPGGDALRPGDVVPTRSGITVEVTDTTTLGTLVLADLLDLARARQPDAIVDIATVGRGPIDAVGPFAGAVMGSDDDLVAALRAAGQRAGEALWPLPLWDELDRRLRSGVADVADTDRATGATPVLAGLLLRRFARDAPWAHIDCSGPALVADELASPLRHAGATGYGVRTLLHWLEHRGVHGA